MATLPELTSCDEVACLFADCYETYLTYLNDLSEFSLDGPISAKNMFGHLKELMCGERWYSKTFPHKSKGIKGIEPDSNPKRSPLMEKLVFIFNPTLLKPIWYETTLYCLLESAWTVCENLNRHCYWFAEKRCHTKPLLTSSPFKPKLFLFKKRRTFFNDLFIGYYASTLNLLHIAMEQIIDN